MREDELFVAAKELQAPYELVARSPRTASCRSSTSAPAASRTPADAALVMQLGAEGVFVGSGIFKSEDPARMANAIVQATTLLRRPGSSPRSRRVSAHRCAGIALEAIPEQERLAVRGW